MAVVDEEQEACRDRGPLWQASQGLLKYSGVFKRRRIEQKEKAIHFPLAVRTIRKK
jgi:hypothetical protein